jgi:hypothetical protein
MLSKLHSHGFDILGRMISSVALFEFGLVEVELDLGYCCSCPMGRVLSISLHEVARSTYSTIASIQDLDPGKHLIALIGDVAHSKFYLHSWGWRTLSVF